MNLSGLLVKPFVLTEGLCKEIYKIVYKGAANTRVHAWYMLPPIPIRLPISCIITFHGYSGSKGLPEDHSAWLLMGYAVLAVDIRGQGGETGNGLPQEYGMTKGWITQGILDPDNAYYRAAAIDGLRAVYCSMAQPELDPDRIFVFLPETIFAAYNYIASTNKSIEVYPFMGHALPPGFHRDAHIFFSKWL
ncbi:Cephalosporin-C deacetylase [compost metagenome]